jgi:DNA-binding beta-propeller fold protein YncE
MILLTARAVVLAVSLAGLIAYGQISKDNWGKVAAPVYGSSNPGYPGAELFTGPKQFGDDYYHGVLPNGRIVRPAGKSVQVGMDPLGACLSPDGKFLVTTNNSDRGASLGSMKDSINTGGYSLSVIDVRTMIVVSQFSAAGKFFHGLQITGNGPYTVWASGGGDNSIKKFTVSIVGMITPAGSIAIRPITSSTSGYVSNYKPGPQLNKADANGNRPPVPTGFDRTAGAAITFPAGSALSPDRKFLFVACNGDNSLAIIDTERSTVVKQLPVGYFPYDVTVSSDGAWVFVSNWGVTEYKFVKPTYDAAGNLIAIAPAGINEPDGYYVPKTDTEGENPKTSSVSIVAVPGGDGTQASLVRSIYMGESLDELNQVGDTHPCAMALLVSKDKQYIYVTKANSDQIAIIYLKKGSGRNAAQLDGEVKKDLDLSPVKVAGVKPLVHGAYPNAIAVSPDNQRAYVAEAGINSVAVLDTKDPEKPKLVGRIPTGWYPSALTLSPDGKILYILNAKGIGEDIGPAGGTAPPSKAPRTAGGLSNIDSNYIFGSAQRVDLESTPIDNTSVLTNNYAFVPDIDDSIVPVGGSKGSGKIKHVFFILHENKTFDSMLGNLAELAPFSSLSFKDPLNNVFTDPQYTLLSKNTQLLASKFGIAVNYYTDSEESDAGHQFSASGTSSDYAEKMLAVKGGRGLLVNKNMDPEDYPESGYIFNNAARHGVSFKDYGALLRIIGTDTGTAPATLIDDPLSGNAGYPVVPLTNPLTHKGDVSSPVQGLGQSYFLAMPILAVLGTNNADGEPRLDHNYPGYNFNISDQRRAQEFCKDFDRMVANGTLPQFLYIYQPNDHTGGIQAKNITGSTAPMQVADGDVALGMVVEHIMRSPVYYNQSNGEGSAIFVTWDDAQSTLDHIHPHRAPLLVISPYVKPGPAKRHYSTASIVKTEELLLGLPPNNLGDLFATDLRDMFQADYNGITPDKLSFTKVYSYAESEEGLKIWELVKNLDTSGPDRDSRRLGTLARISMLADSLHAEAAGENRLQSQDYLDQQARLYQMALALFSEGAGPGGPPGPLAKRHPQ